LAISNSLDSRWLWHFYLQKNLTDKLEPRFCSAISSYDRHMLSTISQTTVLVLHNPT
jgi:hypothetical protein